MEFCRRAGDHSFSLRLPVRDSASPGPGYRRDLPNTFGQLSYPKLTSRMVHLLLPRIGDRNSGGHIGTLSQSATAARHPEPPLPPRAAPLVGQPRRRRAGSARRRGTGVYN